MKNPESRISHPSHTSVFHLTLAALGAVLIGTATPSSANPAQDKRAPDVPPALQVPDGNKVAFHAYAVGVQIYVCRNISATESPQYAWVFKAPEAVLFANAGAEGEIGIHYAGPTWESESGSKVVGARMAGVPVDTTAIPWLILRAVSAEGPGIFGQVTYIQRVNTSGGLAPTTGADAAHEGQEARVPYLAEYYFYHAE